ncbi:MAG: polymerase sigma-70 factor, subfamily [Actinomycetota bacterium]|nr:polymerase sigma-70 factor, subfamily [Actinomycetota bacterium]MEA2487368.1 polymerase sigma-70 factor, subfamily [Actinomycetota bacterium]
MKRPIDTRNEPLNELVPPELVDRCKAGDQRAWAELVDATHREVYTLCLRILRDPDEAAEATQDTFVKVWRSLAGFRGDAAFTTWLYRVAANTAISRHRSRARKRSHEFTGGDEMLTAVASTSSTEAEAASRIDVQQLEQNLEMLPEHYRSAIVLRDVYGWSIEEIAKELKISNTAAKVRVHRGRKKLREMTFPEVGDDR